MKKAGIFTFFYVLVIKQGGNLGLGKFYKGILRFFVILVIKQEGNRREAAKIFTVCFGFFGFFRKTRRKSEVNFGLARQEGKFCRPKKIYTLF